MSSVLFSPIVAAALVGGASIAYEKCIIFTGIAALWFALIVFITLKVGHAYGWFTFYLLTLGFIIFVSLVNLSLNNV